jgi:hypothetical protein
MTSEARNGDNLHCFVGTCWCCGSEEGQRWRLNNGQKVRETLCRNCRDGMKYNGLGMDFEDTPAEKRITAIDSTIDELRKERARLRADLYGANKEMSGGR